MLSEDAALNILANELPTVLSGTVVEVLLNARVAESAGEAKRLIAGGGISVNGKKISEDMNVRAPALIKKGKNTFVLVR